jgi:hypothetical protein
MSNMIYGENGVTIIGFITPGTWGRVNIELDDSGSAESVDLFYTADGNYNYLLTNAYLSNKPSFNKINITVYNITPNTTLGYTNTKSLGHL